MHRSKRDSAATEPQENLKPTMKYSRKYRRFMTIHGLIIVQGPVGVIVPLSTQQEISD